MDERIGVVPPPIAPAADASRHTISLIARRAVPALADFAVVFVVAGRQLVGIASAHVKPEGDRLLRSLQRVYRVRLADLQSTTAQVFRTCRPAIRNGIRLEERVATRGKRIADLHRRLGPRSVLVLPIVRGGRVFGTVSLCYAGSGRAYARGDIPAGERLARALARAIEPAFAHAAHRLCPAVGDARSTPASGRRVASRN